MGHKVDLSSCDYVFLSKWFPKSGVASYISRYNSEFVTEGRSDSNNVENVIHCEF